MLEIKPIQTKEEQKETCELCQIEFDPDCLAYGARENGRLLGISQFRIHGAYAVIYNLADAPGANDPEALSALGQATLGFLHSCEIEEVYIKDGGEERRVDFDTCSNRRNQTEPRIDRTTPL